MALAAGSDQQDSGLWYHPIEEVAVRSERRNGLGMVLALAVGALVLAGCGDDSDEQADATASTTTSTTAVGPLDEDAREPSSTARPGGKVTATLTISLP